jgi:hypothetical protein
MSSYLELDKETLIKFANGTTVNTFTIAATGASTIIDTGPALTQLDAEGWSLVAFSQSGGKSVYIVKHS